MLSFYNALRMRYEYVTIELKIFFFKIISYVSRLILMLFLLKLRKFL